MKKTTSKGYSTKDFINLPESGFTIPKEDIKNYSVKGLFDGVEVELVPITRVTDLENKLKIATTALEMLQENGDSFTFYRGDVLYDSSELIEQTLEKLK